MSPADEAFNPETATDEQLTLFLARQGVSPVDLEAARERAATRIQRVREACGGPHYGRAAHRPWEELELDRLDASAE